MALDKYKKLLSKKQELISKKSNKTSTSVKREYVPFFNPNKYINKGNFTVRVLPNKHSGDLFFIQVKKHSFKIGPTWKNAFCFYSHNENGETVANGCPFCDFIELNKEDLSDDTLYKISPKNNHVLFVYNYQDKAVQKIEANDYLITDILSAIQSNLDDDINIDKEGFDLVYTKGSSGYAEVFSAEKPSISIKKLLEESTNYKEVPDLKSEVIPDYVPPVVKAIESTLSLAIAAFEPTFSENNNNNENEEDLEELNRISEDPEEFDPNEEFDSENETVEPVGIDDDDDENEEDEDDETIEDIEKFLKNRKK